MKYRKLYNCTHTRGVCSSLCVPGSIRCISGTRSPGDREFCNAECSPETNASEPSRKSINNTRIGGHDRREVHFRARGLVCVRFSFMARPVCGRRFWRFIASVFLRWVEFDSGFCVGMGVLGGMFASVIISVLKQLYIFIRYRDLLLKFVLYRNFPKFTEQWEIYINLFLNENALSTPFLQIQNLT